MDNIATTVIVCTRNRAESLRAMLEAIGKLEAPEHATVEVIVVDNGSTDRTREVVSNSVRESAAPIRYVCEPRVGLSVARNRGIAEASGNVLLFTDDDCLPDPSWVASAVRAVEHNPMQVIGGRVEKHHGDDPPMTIQTSKARKVFTPRDQIRGFIHGCNMVIGRQVFQAVGLFDVRFGAGTRLRSAEDTDLIYRALKAGIPVSYDPGQVVVHNHGRDTQEELNELVAGYSLGHGAFAMKHLLRGDTVPAKPCWWELRSAWRRWRADGEPFSRTALPTIIGALKFIFGPSLRRSV